MFERATATLIATTTACAAMAMAVFAAGFALYALVAPIVGPAGAAAIVAATATLIVAACAIYTGMRAKEKEREAELEQARMMNALPLNLGGIARDHPIISIAASVLAGVLAAKHPRLSRDLLSIIARFTQG